jgi:hypothetical protein
MIGEAKSVLEVNPAYRYIGFTGIILLNLAVAWLLWWLYSRPHSTPAARFMLIIAMLMIISFRIYAIPLAYYNIENQITAEQAEVIVAENPEMKLETLKRGVTIAYPPFILGIAAFLFWRLDHKVKKK